MRGGRRIFVVVGKADARLRKAGFASLLESSGVDITFLLLQIADDLLVATGNRQFWWRSRCMCDLVFDESVGKLTDLQEGLEEFPFPIRIQRRQPPKPHLPCYLCINNSNSKPYFIRKTKKQEKM
jgi:hypothetical protein